MGSDLWWVSPPLFPLFVAYHVKCRSQREIRRAGVRAMRELSPADRRVVERAVRHGRPVDDARHARPAVLLEALALQLLWLDAFALLVTYVSLTRRRAEAAKRATLALYRDSS